MKQQWLETIPEQDVHLAELDLVVPFTTPALTQAAIRAAEQLGPGLHAVIRLLKLQMVPYAKPGELADERVFAALDRLDRFDVGLHGRSPAKSGGGSAAPVMRI